MLGRKNRDSISIRTKIIQMQLLLAFVILLVSTAAFFLKDIFYFKESVEKSLEATARILGYSLRPALAFADADQADKILKSLQSETGISSALVTDANGKVFAHHGSSDTSVLLKFQKLNSSTGSLIHENHLYIFSKLEQDHELLGTIFLDASLEFFLSEYRIYLWIGLGVFLSGLLMSLGLAHWSHRALSDPMMALARTARQISRSGDSSLRVTDSQVGQQIEEIGILSAEFNQMLNQIQAKEERIEHEKEMAQRANSFKTQFLANISHELRTPMHGILSFARFGQQKFETASKEKLKSYFDEIHESGARLMSLLNDLLDLSKLEAGKTTYSMTEEDLVQITKVIQSELGAFALEKGVAIEVISSSPTVLAVFDGEKIMQVVRNILSNAIKFSNPGTTIKMALEDQNQNVRCRVINHGVGIPDGELETIFEKFIQSSKTKTGAGGTGLGLAICREIILHHGGKIWAEGKTPGETHFVFQLLKIPVVTKTEVA
jgi:signal transduction histidine kinase